MESEEPFLKRILHLSNSHYKVAVYQHTRDSLRLKVIKMPEAYADDLLVDFPKDQNRFISKVVLIEQLLANIDIDMTGKPILLDSQFQSPVPKPSVREDFSPDKLHQHTELFGRLKRDQKPLRNYLEPQLMTAEHYPNILDQEEPSMR